jgi:septum formation protein
VGAQPKRLLVLASQSPRRKQLLEQLGRELDFEVQVLGPEPDEDAEGLEAVNVGENPLDYVQRVTHLKADAGWRRMLRWTDGGFELPVLVSDTTVTVGDQILGKPGSADEARRMLRLLSGQVHQVHTAVGLAVPVGPAVGSDAVHGQSDSSFAYVQVVSSSNVKFGDLAYDWIDWVIATGEPMDKAGAYAIQGNAASVIEWVHGSPSGVMGLPLFETRELLLKNLYSKKAAFWKEGACWSLPDSRG